MEKAGRAFLAEGTAFANKGSGRKAWAGSGCSGMTPGEVPHLGSPGRVWSTASSVFWKALSRAAVWRNWGQEAKRRGGGVERVADSAQDAIK